MAYDPRDHQSLTFFDAPPRFAAGADTPRDYLERCLAVIQSREPAVKAWVTLNVEGARSAADASTRRYSEGKPLSRIDGMPIGIKDLIYTKDMPTEMGSPLYKGNHTNQDSASIRALREAGAVVLGKTVTTELGMSHPGPTTNPFDSSRTPGGSSSGSAAAVGAGMVPVCIGTQVVGSIIRPASFCANYALKPTYGAINRGERQGFSQSQFGVHAGSLEDLWSVAAEMAARAGGDPGSPGLYGPSQLEPACQPSRLIVMEGEGWPLVDDRARKAFETFTDQLEEMGVRILRRRDSPLIEAFERAISQASALSRDISAFEMRWSLENLVERHPGEISESLMGRLELARKMTLDEYRSFLTARESMQRSHMALGGMADALISLSSLGPAPLMGDIAGSDPGIPHATGNPIMNTPSSALWAPTITLPMLAVAGMPVGVQLIGQQHQDARVARLARWLRDQARPVLVS
ncbi:MULTISPECIES: amidase [unclassified Variovorax]|uniref:amidase n=1 Tax=unclassified Variovorax TaxID=663243 RepID=UPI00076BEF94|nr:MULTISPECIES: amidase [unclassified Variovorax]KWT97957.1 amidase [Variovorax sp. WDL1]PNG59204.1 putative amidase AmiD [Variovorax sp. B4]PNG61005.1 putative amidase AmiD [Variovorax sp. B2]VTV13057.1 Biuret hydrolase [Variovorax sp. WDL1]